MSVAQCSLCLRQPRPLRKQQLALPLDLLVGSVLYLLRDWRREGAVQRRHLRVLRQSRQLQPQRPELQDPLASLVAAGALRAGQLRARVESETGDPRMSPTLLVGWQALLPQPAFRQGSGS
jgi:hypothetical protein